LIKSRVGFCGLNPTILGAIGMLSGFCGTLMTLLAVNTLLMYAFVFRFRQPTRGP